MYFLLNNHFFFLEWDYFNREIHLPTIDFQGTFFFFGGVFFETSCFLVGKSNKHVSKLRPLTILLMNFDEEFFSVGNSNDMSRRVHRNLQVKSEHDFRFLKLIPCKVEWVFRMRDFFQ